MPIQLCFALMGDEESIKRWLGEDSLIFKLSFSNRSRVWV
jgi:hypothetical protein